jgi:hypothetical protein
MMEDEPAGRGPSSDRYGGQNIVARDGATIAGVTQISGDALFQIFVNAPASLSGYIRIRQFKELIEERTRHFIGRDFLFHAIDDIIARPDFPSGYLLIRGEPGIGKTALIGQLVKTRGYVHHFNIAPQNIRSARAFLENVCAQLLMRYELREASLSEDAFRDRVDTLLTCWRRRRGGKTRFRLSFLSMPLMRPRMLAYRRQPTGCICPQYCRTASFSY